MNLRKWFTEEIGYLTIQIIYNLALGLTGGLLTIYFIERGLTYTQLGFIWSLMLVINALTDFPTGNLADRFGRLKIYCVGLIFMGVGYLIFGYGLTFQIYLLAAVVIGIGESLTSGSLVAWIVDAFNAKGKSDELTKTFGNVRFISSGAGIIGGVIVGLFLKNYLQVAFFLQGYLLIGSAIAHYLLLPDNHGSKEASAFETSEKSLKMFVKNKALYHFTFATINSYLLYTFFLFTWQPLGIKVGLSSNALGYVNSLYIFFSGLGGFIWGKLDRKLGKTRLILVSIILMGISFNSFIFITARTSFLAVMCIFSFAYGSFFPIFMKWQNDHIPQEVRASVMSLITSISTGTVILAQILVGKLADMQGITLICKLGAVVMLLQFINFGMLIKFEKRYQSVQIGAE